MSADHPLFALLDALVDALTASGELARHLREARRIAYTLTPHIYGPTKILDLCEELGHRGLIADDVKVLLVHRIADLCAWASDDVKELAKHVEERTKAAGFVEKVPANAPRCKRCTAPDELETPTGRIYLYRVGSGGLCEHCMKTAAECPNCRQRAFIAPGKKVCERCATALELAKTEQAAAVEGACQSCGIVGSVRRVDLPNPSRTPRQTMVVCERCLHTLMTVARDEQRARPIWSVFCAWCGKGIGRHPTRCESCRGTFCERCCADYVQAARERSAAEHAAAKTDQAAAEKCPDCERDISEPCASTEQAAAGEQAAANKPAPWSEGTCRRCGSPDTIGKLVVGSLCSGCREHGGTGWES